MNKLDHKLLRAFSAVMQYQSFDKAADKLALTQSAVSQRIKQLEVMVAQPVLIRSQPLVATQLGKKLLSHYHQVEQLEADLFAQILPDQLASPLTISLATNADSLASWLIPGLTPVMKCRGIELNLITAGEERTLAKLKDGEVFGAISVADKPLSGCLVTKLGDMDYVLVASKEFERKYFAKGVNQTSLRAAPAVAFDHQDDMHLKFIEQHFDLDGGNYPCHRVRSSQAFVEMTKLGTVYSLIAKQLIHEELANGQLINILPQHKRVRTLYWHRWALAKGIYKQVSDAIIDSGQIALRGKKLDE